MKVTKEMVDRFLSWPLPDSVCSDLCATKQNYPHRSGTNLLNADEARQMLTHVLQDIPEISVHKGPRKYIQKSPVLVEAEQWFPGNYVKGVQEVVHDPGDGTTVSNGYAHIETAAGCMQVKPGDWIITGASGEQYTCKAEEFAKNYDECPTRVGFFTDGGVSPEHGMSRMFHTECPPSFHGRNGIMRRTTMTRKHDGVELTRWDCMSCGTKIWVGLDANRKIVSIQE